MVRAFFAAVVTLALGGVVKAETYNIQVWPDDLDKVPCDAWKKNPRWKPHSNRQNRHRP